MESGCRSSICKDGIGNSLENVYNILFNDAFN